jgi:hypothetical protein
MQQALRRTLITPRSSPPPTAASRRRQLPHGPPVGIYLARWQARAHGQADGVLKVFMDHFADCYDDDEK